jgi:hypothetical protein
MTILKLWTRRFMIMLKAMEVIMMMLKVMEVIMVMLKVLK